MNHQVPVLFIVFNRPDATEQVFKAIRAAKPKKLYISCDAPRNSKEESLCHEVKEIVAKVDWDCDVQRRYQDENLGCKLNLSSSISWFFEYEESGIILEDDCLPSPSFFQFAAIMLEKYKDEPRVMQISGNNYLSDDFKLKEDYYFTTINDIWGWATWRRAWNLFDLKMEGYHELKKNGAIQAYYKNREITDWTTIYLDEAIKPECTIWSPQWVYALIKYDGITIAPATNLIQNIGFLEGENTDSNLHHEYGTVEAKDYNFTNIADLNLELKPNYRADKDRFKKIKRTDVNIFPATKLKRNIRHFIYRFISPEKRKSLKKIFKLS